MNHWSRKETERMKAKFWHKRDFLKESQIDRILQLIAAGLNDVSIVQETGISVYDVTRIRKEYRPDIVSPMKSAQCSMVSEDELAEIVKAVKEENITYEELGKRFGYSDSGIYQLVKRIGFDKPVYKRGEVACDAELCPMEEADNG